MKYANNLLQTWTGYDSDHLSYNDIVDEFCNELGFFSVQQLIASVPSGSYYEAKGNSSIRCLLEMVGTDSYNYVINWFVVEECEMSIQVPNITQYDEVVVHDYGVATNCSSTEGEDRNKYDSESSKYDSDELDSIATQGNMSITNQLNDYKELEYSMVFKNIYEARNCLKLYVMANKKEIVHKKVIQKDLGMSVKLAAHLFV